jgi:hypothetical protein
MVRIRPEHNSIKRLLTLGVITDFDVEFARQKIMAELKQ